MANKESLVRERAKAIKPYRCKNLIAVIENPNDIKNIGTIIRNVNALGVDKTYIIDPKNKLPDDWQEMRERKSLSKTSVSAIKWSFVKRQSTLNPHSSSYTTCFQGRLTSTTQVFIIIFRRTYQIRF